MIVRVVELMGRNVKPTPLQTWEPYSSLRIGVKSKSQV